MQKLTHGAATSLQNLADASRQCMSPNKTVSSLTDRDIETIQDRFRQWAANIGALQPPTSSVSLDHRLRNAPSTTSAISGFLRDLSISANHAADIASAKRPNRVAVETIKDLDSSDYDISSSDSESSTTSSDSHHTLGNATVDELQQLIKAIKISLNNLFKSSALITRLSVKTRRQRARNLDSYPSEFDAAFIRDAFPLLSGSGTPESEALILRLAEANARRRQYFKYCQERHDQLREEEEERKESTPAMTVPRTAATELLGDPMSSKISSSGEVRSTMSISTSVFKEDQETMLFPPFPSIAGEENSFICHFCLNSITLGPGNKKKRWHEHVLADLEPYVCTFLTCSLDTFSSSKAWLQHELRQHRRIWLCRLCGDQSASQQALIQHLTGCHQSVRSDQIPVFISETAQTIGEKAPAPCPFCGEDWFLVHSAATRKRDLSVENFQRHIGKHLRRIALFTLPRPDTDAIEFKCFFAVLDPEGTQKLRGTKNSACLGSFNSVNRLKEHIWRAHSPTHNCVHCRMKTTKPTEEFREQHSRCTSKAGTGISRPMPVLMSQSQAENLQSLNEHFDKPNDESIRCENLWCTIFPDIKFDGEHCFVIKTPSEEFGPLSSMSTNLPPLGDPGRSGNDSTTLDRFLPGDHIYSQDTNEESEVVMVPDDEGYEGEMGSDHIAHDHMVALRAINARDMALAARRPTYSLSDISMGTESDY